MNINSKKLIFKFLNIIKTTTITLPTTYHLSYCHLLLSLNKIQVTLNFTHFTHLTYF